MTVEEFKSYYNNCLLFGTTNEDGTVEIGDMLCEPCKSGARIVGVVKGRNPSHIELDERITEIGEYAFFNCKSLVNVNIPSKVKIIRHSTFERCESLKNIYTGDHVEKIEKSAFKECSSLEEIKTSDYLSEIGDWAFEWCENLKSISFGSGLRRIGKYAFDAPLSSCSITCKAYEPPYLDETSIYRWKGYWVKIYVPQSSVSAYQRTYPWNKFDIKAAY